MIRRWWSRWPNALVGVHAGPSGVAVGDIDMGEGKDGWFSINEAEVDIPETFTYKTRSGGDHFVYAAPGGIALGPTKKHVTPDGVVLNDVDRRAGSSYFIWWSNEIPADRSAFAPAPTWLLTPAAVPSGLPFDGSVEEWLARCPQGEASAYVTEWINSLPVDDFGHHEMIALQAALIYMAVEGETGVPAALQALRGAWLRGPYDTPGYREDFDRSLAGAIAKYGKFPPKPEDILTVDPLDLMGRLSRQDLELVTGMPIDGENAATLRRRVARVATAGLAAGFSVFDAAALALSSAAAQGIRAAEDGGVAEAWRIVGEVISAPVEDDLPDVTATFGSAPVAVAPPKPKHRAAPSLLTPQERLALGEARAAARERDAFLWWGDEFMWVQDQIQSIYTEAYMRLNRWTILALILGNRAVFKWRNQTRTTLNFYGANLGPSGTGKSESLQPIEDMLKLMDDSPDIGDDATVSALYDALVPRNGKTSWFHSDEASKTISEWADKRGIHRGVRQKITEAYRGYLPPINRATKKEVSGIAINCYLNMTWVGVLEDVADVIEPDDWKNGYMNRVIWAIGEEKPVPEESMLLQVDDGLGGGVDPDAPQMMSWAQKWMAQFMTIARKIETLDGEPARLNITPELNHRQVEVRKRLAEIAGSSPYRDRLQPTFTRLHEVILKCAALVALTRQTLTVDLECYLIAAEQAEEWVQNAITMVEATDRPAESRRKMRLLDLIVARGGFVSMTELYRMDQFGDDRQLEVLIGRLVKEQRVKREPMPGMGEVVRVVNGGA